MLQPEKDDGHIEYKYCLDNDKPTSDEYFQEKKLTQLSYRLENGDDRAVIYLGVTDNGTPVGLTQKKLEENMTFLKGLLNKMGCVVENYHVSTCAVPVEKLLDPHKKLYQRINGEEVANPRYLARVSYVKNGNTPYTPLRLTVAGNVDSGKSTLIGVLTRQELDDGKGKMRQHVFRYPHEKESGRTSSVSCEYLKFNSNGEVARTGKREVLDLEGTTRVCTFYDSPGHAKYYKTTARNICGAMPDYSMIVVGSNMGITEMTKEHMIVSYINGIPMFVVLTKIDMCPDSVYENILKRLTRIAESLKLKYLLMEDDITMWNYCNDIHEDKKFLPVIPVSNKTGHNIDLLTTFIRCLPCFGSYEEKVHNPLYFSIQSDYSVPGVGTVVYGLISDGKINAKGTYWLGPDCLGQFKKVYVKSIQNKRQNVNTAVAGQDVTLCFRNIARDEISKGMVVLDSPQEPKGQYSIKAKISVIGSQSKDKVIGTHSTTIRERFEPVIHIGNVKQTARITKIEKISERFPSAEKTETEKEKEKEKETNMLRVGDSAHVNFSIKYRSIYVKPGMHILFREGRTRGYGIVEETSHEKVMAVPGE